MKADKALEDLQKAMQHIQLAIWPIKESGVKMKSNRMLVNAMSGLLKSATLAECVRALGKAFDKIQVYVSIYFFKELL